MYIKPAVNIFLKQLTKMEHSTVSHIIGHSTCVSICKSQNKSHVTFTSVNLLSTKNHSCSRHFNIMCGLTQFVSALINS